MSCIYIAKFDENPATTLQDIREAKRYIRMQARTYGPRENSLPTIKFVGDQIVPLKVVVELISPLQKAI